MGEREPDLPELEEVYLDFLREMRKARPGPVIMLSARPADPGRQFPAVARWVQGYGHIEIGYHEGLGFVARALDSGGVVFEDTRAEVLPQALAVLEQALARWFQGQGIEVEPADRRPH